MSRQETRVLETVFREVADRVTSNAGEAERLAEQVNQHAATINQHAAALERLQDVVHVLLNEVRGQSELLRRVLLKLDNRDG